MGVGAALFMLVSKYGFADVLANEHTVLDPSRVAAQVVSGIGFIGGGLIFVGGHLARGYPTAAFAPRLPASNAFEFAVRVVYEDGRGILREVLGESTRGGYAVQRVTTRPLEAHPVAGVAAVAVTLEVHGQPGVEHLVTTLDALPASSRSPRRSWGRRPTEPGGRPDDAPVQRSIGQPDSAHVPTPPSTTWTTCSAPSR